MSDRPDDSQARKGEGFSARWSRRKTAERERAKDADLEAIPEPAESQLKSSAQTYTEPETETEPGSAFGINEGSSSYVGEKNDPLPEAVSSQRH